MMIKLFGFWHSIPTAAVISFRKCCVHKSHHTHTHTMVLNNSMGQFGCVSTTVFDLMCSWARAWVWCLVSVEDVMERERHEYLQVVLREVMLVECE